MLYSHSARRLRAAVDPDTAAWALLASNNGGAVTERSFRAVDFLATAIRAAGLRDAMRRLNPCAGFNLAASLIPLYQTVGSTIDTNVNMLSTDYAEHLGWSTDGFSKWINTGYIPSEATGGLYVYLRTALAQDSTGRTPLGSSGGTLGVFRITQNRGASGANVAGAVNSFWGGSSAQISCVKNSGGMVPGGWHAVRRGATDLEMYSHGVSVATQSESITPASNGVTLGVMAGNTISTPAFCGAGNIAAGYSVDTGLTSPDVATFNDIWETFQTMMGRAV